MKITLNPASYQLLLEHNLSPARLHLLLAADPEASATVAELGETLGMTRLNTNTLCQTLLKRKLLKRKKFTGIYNGNGRPPVHTYERTATADKLLAKIERAA